jgi:hypothetical protein
MQDMGRPAHQPHRTWVVQQDQEGLAGSEAVLKAVRAEASGGSRACKFQPWEEVDSQAAVFGSKNLLGAAAEVVQRQGELLSLQVQSHAHGRMLNASREVDPVNAVGWVEGGLPHYRPVV